MNENRFRIFFLISVFFIIGKGGLLFAQSETIKKELSDTASIRFPVTKTIPETESDLEKKSPIDLQTPSNIKTDAVYDAENNRYIFQNKIGDTVVGEPFIMTPEQYMAYRMRLIQYNYFKEKNSFDRKTKEKKSEPFSLFGIRKSSNVLEDIFGPGGIQLKTQGTAGITTGIKRTAIDNPTLPERSRVRNTFNFDEDIQLSVNAKVGNKIGFDMNYNTDATFDFDSKRVNLGYQGDEDEIIKNIEAGNVSMTTSNSLINSGAALFGIKADLQFGKLKVNTVVSQQNSQSQTVNAQGGVQTSSFEFTADEYDENLHFFLGFYFRDNYDNALSKLPYIQSSVSITRMEVWVTNKSGNYDNARNIVAFADLGEYDRINNSIWTPQGSKEIPYNMANSLYGDMTSTYVSARDIGQAANVLPGNVIVGQDYEKMESARMLSASEYTYQAKLGYISLNTALQSDEVLAVAYEYTYNGKVYQVGEFSSDIPSSSNGTVQSGSLFLKLLKPVSLSPSSYTWDLMMKNIYSVGYGSQLIQSDNFEMNIGFQSDTMGVYLNYIPDGNINNELLLRVMKLDRLNSKNNPYPDGKFDFVDGYTVSSTKGKIIFPVVEPFGSHLRKMIGNNTIADKYVYQELYDSTLTVAKQNAEKNKFRMSGAYSGSSGSMINLNATNLTSGSVTVTAAGVTLTEGSDYTVDYTSGTVTIINQSIIDAGTSVSVSVNNQSLYSSQRKTLVGLNLLYDFSRDFSAGVTIMHLSEKPTVVKTGIGEESVKNTLWGANLSYKKQSQLITNLLNKLPFVEATAPSQLTFNAEFAQMIAGHYENNYTGAYSYIDDFETSSSGIDLSSPYPWTLASTPLNNTSTGLFPEASLSNNIDYGKNRAQLAWFYIDRIFTRQNSSLTPEHLKNDKDQLSNHLVREIYEREIYPNKQTVYGESATLPVLNLSFYPNERGPYNLDTDIDSDGHLLNPRKRWGGITRKMDTRNFESTNIEYIQFWLMDPFVNDTLGTSQGGDLYFNLGEISEDILKDGKKFFENGLPIDGDTTAVGYTVWGKYPKRQSTVYAFDNSQGNDARRIQDVGLNGLSVDEEKSYPTYADYLQNYITKLSGDALARMQSDDYSPINAPAGDKFRHYRGTENDNKRLSILNRYKYYNGTEGNSLSPEEGQKYATAARTTPDVEDINNDNTLNETEAYYQYKVQLRPKNMEVGSNYITDKREVSMTLRNGQQGHVTWYQFKVPIREYQTKIGNIQGFNNIRFMRMFLTDFDEPVFLRFATLQLMYSEWRNYTKDLDTGGTVSGLGTLEISTVNIEENGDRSPVNYVLPPGITRVIDPSQPQLRQENEQSLSLKIKNLEDGESRSVYRNVGYDMRRFKKLQLFVHAEALPEDAQDLKDGDLSVFLRLGSDYRNNYYEYEIPLEITPAGQYSTNRDTDREMVWKSGNMFNFALKLLTDLKLNRNAEKRKETGVTYYTAFSEQDPDKPQNRITILGNPSLSEVKVMMIGIRNKSGKSKSGVIWVNELRLNDFDEDGGWAAQGNMNLALSDIGNINVAGRKETVGFGALDQRLLERRSDDFKSVSVALNLDLGRFLPKQAKASIPFYYSYSNEKTTPQYDPLDQDILLSVSRENANNKQERDSITNLSIEKAISKNLSFSNVKADIKSKTPMPYDPANFTFAYSYSESKQQDPETEYASVQDYKLQANYSYSPIVRTYEPFKNLKSTSGWLKFAKSLNFNYLPSNIQFNSAMVRNYQETQLRDLEAYKSGNTESQSAYLTFSQNFLWTRNFTLVWDLTRNLKTSFRSGTIAEIEEPYLQVNKKINRDDYEIWKDSVMQSIRNLGKPLNYEQTADVTYTLPFRDIPALDWINSSAAYNSNYRWERGSYVEDATIGNYIQNNLSLAINSRFNLVSLYNKSGFLRKVNQRFDGGAATANQSDLSENNTLYDIAQYAARGLMMLRNINISIGYKTRNDIPGFSPMIGDVFGQQNASSGLVPGLGFAFGFDGGANYINKALENGWLVIDENNIDPAIYNKTRNFRFDAGFEPAKGLKIELNGLYENNRRTEIQYMYDDMPKSLGGSFAISTNMLSSAFENSNSGNNYRSASFNKFLSNIEVVTNRFTELYKNSVYPNSGFIGETSFGGAPYNSELGSVNPYSAEVLIPAFLAAYTGKSAEKTGLTAFPDLRSIVPNWDVSYNAMNMFPWLRNHFKSFVLTHKYVSQYRIGSYSSYTDWVSAGDSDLGFTSDAVTGNPMPSSLYDIQSVSLIESFSPLIEARGTFANNMSVNLRFNKTRTVNLNTASSQIIESTGNDVIIGFGYRIADFNRVIGFGSNSRSTRTSNTNRQRTGIQTEQSTQNNQPNASSKGGFNNDLNIRMDVAVNTTHALIRKIVEQYTQATSGLRTTTIRLSADYSLSRSLTLRAFFDKAISMPLVSSSSYPTAETSTGVSLQFNLNQ